MLILISALIAFTITATGAALIDLDRAKRADRIGRITQRAEIGTPYRGPFYTRHGRAIGDSK